MKLLKSRFGATMLAFVAVNVILAMTIGNTGANLANVFKQSSDISDPLFRTWTWWTVKGYFDQPRVPDVVLLGSSQMNSAAWSADAYTLKQPVDCITHRRVGALEQQLKNELGSSSDISVLNCAFQGSMASDYYMVGRALFSDANKPHLVIVGVSPRDFIDNKLAAASATEPFRFLCPYVDTGKMSAIAFPDFGARLQAQSEWTLNKLGLRRLHDVFDSWISANAATTSTSNTRHKTNELLNAICNSSVKVRPGQYVVPATMSDLWVDNTAEYASRYRVANPPSYKIQLAFFGEFLDLMKEKHIKTVVVGMPTLPMNRALLPESFWSTYRQNVADLCRRHNAQWWDMSQDDTFQKCDYVDTVHVNSRGAVKLVQTFAHLVAGNPELAQCFNALPGTATGAREELAGTKQTMY